MNKKLAVLTAIFALTAGYVMAEEMNADTTTTTTTTTTVTAPAADVMAPMEMGNKICPISGEEVDPATAEKITYKGHIFNVCAKGKEAFDKTPDEVSAKLDAMLAEGMKVEEAGEDAAQEAAETDGDDAMNADVPAPAEVVK